MNGIMLKALGAFVEIMFININSLTLPSETVISWTNLFSLILFHSPPHFP